MSDSVLNSCIHLPFMFELALVPPLHCEVCGCVCVCVWVCVRVCVGGAFYTRGGYLALV